MSAQPAEPGGLPGFHRVGPAAQLQEGQRMQVTLSGRSIVLFRLAQGILAIPAECPHNGGPICEGDVTGSVVSCPWHGYNFDLITGLCEDDEDLSLERFEVRVAGDDIWIKL